MSDTEPPNPPKPNQDDVKCRHDVFEQVLSPDTLPEGVEFLGEGFVSLDHYFKAELEELIDPSIRWILDALDMRRVKDRFEGPKYRYLCESGTIYRLEVTGPELGE
jgi:hypothetical protein